VPTQKGTPLFPLSPLEAILDYVVLGFCCTKKVLTELRLSPTSVPRPQDDTAPQMCWYVDLLTMMRTKNLVMMNPSSGYVVCLFDVNRKAIQGLPELFRDELQNLMQFDEIPPSHIRSIVDPEHEVRYCRTNDRRTLAHINQIKYAIVARVANALQYPLPDNWTEFTAGFNRELYGPHWDPQRAFAKLLGIEGPEPRGRSR
jgi:hypothetical protein